MKSKPTLITVIIYLITAITFSSYGQHKVTMLPGTAIPVKVVNEINSDDNAEAKIIVANDVKDASGNILITANTPVNTYTNKVRANRYDNWKAGTITITFQSTTAADGTYIELDGNHSAQGEDGKKALGGSIKIGNKAIGKEATPAIIKAETIIDKVFTKTKYEIKTGKDEPPPTTSKNINTENKTAVASNSPAKILCFQSKKKCDYEPGYYETYNIQLNISDNKIEGAWDAEGCGGGAGGGYSGFKNADTLFLTHIMEALGDEVEEYTEEQIWLLKSDKLSRFETIEKNKKMVLKNPQTPKIIYSLNKINCK